MTYSIRHSIEAPMAHCGSNSLSPEPCVLSTARSMPFAYLRSSGPTSLAAATAADRTSEHAKSEIGRWVS